MATLETLEHLALWCQGMGRDYDATLNDPFAQMVLDRATELVVDVAGLPATWETDPTLVPSRARMITLLVAARTYTNPRSIINEGTGPLSESMLAKMAAAMELTPDERADLEQIANENGNYGGLWVLSTTAGPETLVSTVHLPDNSPSDWWIPYFKQGDVGTEWLTPPADPEPIAPGDAPTMAQFAALQSLVAGLTTTKTDKSYVDTQDSALDARLDVVEANDVSLDARMDAAEADLLTKAESSDVAAADSALDARLDAVEAELPNKADTSDLGPQIHLGATPPASGSGELWADTDPA